LSALVQPMLGSRPAGSISEVLIEHGHDVISTDLVDRGYGTGGVDFLLEWRRLHREGHFGPLASTAIDHCWVVWEHGHNGPGTTIGRLP
jgi:hypothetical protein